MSTVPQQQTCRRVISAGNATATGAGASIFTKHNNLQNLNTYMKKKCSSAKAIVTAHRSHSSDEKLFIEGLEQKHQQKQGKTVWKSTRHFSERSLNISCSSAGDAGYCPRQSQIVDDILAGSDFTVYQGGDVSDFFRATENPQHVSEVCLVNDHFILVKMPESYSQRRNSPTECIVEEVNEVDDRIAKDHHRRQVKSAQEVMKAETENAQNGERKATISKYFQCHRSRKISPIHEELQEAESSSTIGDELIMKTKSIIQRCWSAAPHEEDQEVFMTHTKIRKNLVLSKPKVKEVTVKETEKLAQLQNAALNLRVKRVRIQEGEEEDKNVLATNSNGSNVELVSSLFGSPLKSFTRASWILGNCRQNYRRWRQPSGTAGISIGSNGTQETEKRPTSF